MNLTLHLLPFRNGSWNEGTVYSSKFSGLSGFKTENPKVRVEGINLNFWKGCCNIYHTFLSILFIYYWKWLIWLICVWAYWSCCDNIKWQMDYIKVLIKCLSNLLHSCHCTRYFSYIIFNLQKNPVSWTMTGHTGLCLRTPTFRGCKHLI